MVAEYAARERDNDPIRFEDYWPNILPHCSSLIIVGQFPLICFSYVYTVEYPHEKTMRLSLEPSHIILLTTDSDFSLKDKRRRRRQCSPPRKTPNTILFANN